MQNLARKWWIFVHQIQGKFIQLFPSFPISPSPATTSVYSSYLLSINYKLIPIESNRRTVGWNNVGYQVYGLAIPLHCTTLLHFKATGHGSVQFNYSFVSCVEIYELTVYNCFASNLRGPRITPVWPIQVLLTPGILLSGFFLGIAQAEPNTWHRINLFTDMNFRDLTL